MSESIDDCIKRILNVGIVKKLTSLECEYIGILKKGHLKPEAFYRLILDLEKNFSRIVRQASKIKKICPANSVVREILERYEKDVRATHQEVCNWLSLYCDMRWPAEIQSGTYHIVVKAKQLSGIRDSARIFWDSLTRRVMSGREKNLGRLISLREALDHDPVNSVEWRLAFQIFSDEVWRQVHAQVVGGMYEMRNKFQRALMQGISRRLSTQHLSSQTRPFFKIQKIADWLHGYCLSPGISDSSALRKYLDDVTRVFQWVTVKVYLKRTFFVAVCIACLTGTGIYTHTTKLDQRLARLWHFHINTLFKGNPNARALNAKKSYFDAKIKDIHEDYSEKIIRKNLTEFSERYRFQQDPSTYEYFIEHILKGFFLLLPDGSIDPDLASDVIDASYQLVPEMGNSVETISRLYSKTVIREQDLRKVMLDMRRSLVERRVFTFIFIALKDDVPYLFLFPERITMRYFMSDQAFEKLGLDPQKYRTREALTYLVPGDRYPFSDQAGYYEGEFAVVFERLTPKPDWTVQHEIGHVVDKLRFRREKVPYLENSEVNAMLFPLIWDSDRRDYLTYSLLKRAMKKDYFDTYTQAAKGILNGLALKFHEWQGESFLRDDKITDQFEEGRIERIVQNLNSLSSEELKSMALSVYKDPEKYLSTAKAGRYRRQPSSFQEVIYGTDHGVSYQGFILNSPGFSLGRKGPRLLLAGFGNDEGLNVSFNLWAFLKNVLRLVVSPWTFAPQSTGRENLVAAILTFIFFNGFAFLIHTLSAPYRKRKFYGRDPAHIVQNIYEGHAWSDGESFGRAQNEKQLLQKVFACQGNISAGLRDEILQFKAIAEDRRRLLFDCCLLFAPFNPQETEILHKGHDLLFFLPWLGPWVGRATWLLPVQKVFAQKECYNQDLAALLISMNSRTGSAEFVNKIKMLLVSYYTSYAENETKGRDHHTLLGQLSKEILDSMREEKHHYHVNLQFITTLLNQVREESQEFDRLDLYSPGDDIRHIDWRATARALYDRPVVRRFSSPYGIRLGLVLEMRFLNTPEGRKQWRQDFIKVLNIFEEDSLLERLIFILPSGKIEQRSVNLRIHRNRLTTTQKVLTFVQEHYAAIFDKGLKMDIRGLKFYTPHENIRFLNQVNLTDFGESPQHMQHRRMILRKMNIFTVGVRIPDIRDIQEMISGENKVFILANY